MRKLILAAVGATALATASMANAAITINTCSPVLTSCTASNTATQSTIAFSNPSVAAGAVSADINFTNTLAGLYTIIVDSTTTGFAITNVTLGGNTLFSGSAQTTGFLNLTLGMGTYDFTFTGTSPSPNGGAVSGNVTFNLVPVPEPATWAMMLLGFAGIGFAMRRRSRPSLAQVA